MANPWNSEIPFSYDTTWFGVQTCKRHIQKKTSGDENLHWLQYCVRTYMQGAIRGRTGERGAGKPADAYRCLILGANEGKAERRLSEEGFAGQIVSSDIADKALARAREKSVAAGYDNITYVVADLNTAEFEGPFDFIVAEGVLHHIEKVERCLQMLARALAPGGLIFAVEFEGPVRFQLSALQVQWINAALAVLPRVLRPLAEGAGGGEAAVRPATRAENERILYEAPPAEAIAAFDPSEAVSGEALKRLLPVYFERVERKGFGGPILAYIGAHFDFARTNSDAFAREWLEVLIRIEDTLIKTGILEDQFVFYVVRRKRGEAAGRNGRDGAARGGARSKAVGRGSTRSKLTARTGVEAHVGFVGSHIWENFGEGGASTVC